MKKVIFLLVFIVGFQSVQAQLFTNERVRNLENFDKKRWSWGFYLGLNTYDFDFDYEAATEDIIVNKNIGFNVGILGNFRLNDYIDFRLEPGAVFVRRTLTFPNDKVETVKSTYIHIPLLVKFSTKRINNFKPFVLGGVSTSFNLSSNEGNSDPSVFHMETNTYYWEVGFGIDFYFNWFKFSPSIRGVFAINNEWRPTNTTFSTSVQKMASRGIFLNFTFQ